MDILPYTEDHRIFRDAMRKFLEREMAPHVDEWEEAGIVPREAWRAMGEQGFLCMDVPEEYPIARAWRDTRVLSIFAGTSEIMKVVAARFMGL